MASYIYLENYNKKGLLGVSLNVFKIIGEKALKQIKELNIKDEEFINKVDVSVKDNKARFKITAFAYKQYEKEDLTSIIKDAIENNLLSLCEAVPFEISIKVSYK